ncbi:hypothetical protein D3C75_1196960 [compost metagenome]
MIAEFKTGCLAINFGNQAVRGVIPDALLQIAQAVQAAKFWNAEVKRVDLFKCSLASG